MHTPGGTENKTGGLWEKRVIEKRMEEVKIEERKGKLRKVLTLLEEEALAPGKFLIRQSFPSVSKFLMQKRGQEKFSSCS